MKFNNIFQSNVHSQSIFQMQVWKFLFINVFTNNEDNKLFKKLKLNIKHQIISETKI